MPPRLGIRRPERLVPAAIALLSFSGVITTLSVYSHEAPGSGYLSRLWGSLLAFAGTYLPLRGQSASPSTLMSLGGVLSLGATIVAAAAALAALTQDLRDYVRIRRSPADLVIIGGVTAAHLIRSPLTQESRRTVLITDDRPALRAVAALAGAVVMERDVAALPADRDAIALCLRSAQVAVTTNQDATNLEIARALTAEPRKSDPRVMALVSDPMLVDELRPPVISATLRLPFDLTSPSENVAERIGHRLDDLLLTDAEIRAAGRVSIALDGDDGPMARGVFRVLVRYAWSRSFLVDASHTALPSVEIEEEATEPRDILVVVRESRAEAAAVALKAARRRTSSPQFILAVTDPTLLAHRFDPKDVFDPVADGWDRALLFDGLRDQWARSFHYAYNVLFVHEESVSPWDPNSRGGQSSYAAVDNMLAVLDGVGCSLRKTDEAPRLPHFTTEEVTGMARAEHESWLERLWKPDDGPCRRVAGDAKAREADVPWEKLPAAMRALNERLPTQTYPALAALFGYEIVRVARSAAE